MKYEIRQSVPGDVDQIAPRLRNADLVEIEATTGHSPHDALRISFEKSSIALTFVANGRPEMMFGVSDLNILTQTGTPWLLGTDEAVRHRTFLLRQSIKLKKQLLSRYARLVNFVDGRNSVSINWLRWLGFSIGDPQPIGRNGEMLHFFELRHENV